MTKTFVLAGSLIQCGGHGSAAAVWLTFNSVKKKKTKVKNGDGEKEMEEEMNLHLTPRSFWHVASDPLCLDFNHSLL